MTAIERFENWEKKLRERYGEPGGRIVTVSGLSGVGKSTLARFLGDELEMDVVSSGSFFREEARRRDMPIHRFMEKVDDIGEREGLDFDLRCDKKIMEVTFKKEECIFDGRLTGVLLKDIADVRVLVTCDPGVVAERVAEREGVSEEEGRKRVKGRNEEDIKRYREKYGVDVTDEKHYNVLIDNSSNLEKSRREVLKKVKEKLGD